MTDLATMSRPQTATAAVALRDDRAGGAAGLLGRLEQLRAWAHRGAVRSAVLKVVATAVGGAVIAAGVAMLLLPGPGLAVIGLGLAILATEWDWAKRVLTMVRAKLSAARARALPKDGSRARRAAGAAAVVAIGAIGFLATTAVTAVLSASTLM